jgi:hypothetical protein
MKKALLILLAISMIFILSGFTLAAAGGYAISRNITYSGNFKRLSEPKTTEKTVDAKSCSKVDLSLVNANLEIVKYDGDQIKLDYEEIYENEWAYSFDGSTMKLKNVRYNDWSSAISGFYNFLNDLKTGNFNLDLDFGIHSDDSDMMHTVKVYVPEKTDTAFSVSNVNGGIQFNSLQAKSLNVSLVNSSLDVSDSSLADNIKLQSVNGQISMKNVQSPLLSISSVVNAQCTIESPQFNEINASSFVNGGLKLTGVSDPGDYSVSYSLVNGSVTVGGSSYTGSGNINGGSNKITFHGVNGDLSIKN